MLQNQPISVWRPPPGIPLIRVGLTFGKHKFCKDCVYFLWIAFKDHLMTNLERFLRSVGHHPSCTICDTQDESTLHVLRDCKFAREVWLYFSPVVYSPTFFTMNLQAWLMSNIHCHDLISEYSIPWSTFFVSILWQLWKAKNEHVFNSVPQSPTDVWSKGIFWARCYMESFLLSPTRSPESRTSH
ncbi:hypothetical protein V6N12_042546 [Hibiscus sabdariffa]|uniref:Reverse transcriptase zinc-binding domain-containing protein n=1 Tax=Hibiscus sabdariffa TaxID=183260 RepID=A0ABR2EF32_9ROSI